MGHCKQHIPFIILDSVGRRNPVVPFAFFICIFFIAFFIPSIWKSKSILPNQITLELEIKSIPSLTLLQNIFMYVIIKNDDIIVSLLVVSINLLLNLPIVK